MKKENCHSLLTVGGTGRGHPAAREATCLEVLCLSIYITIQTYQLSLELNENYSIQINEN